MAVYTYPQDNLCFVELARAQNPRPTRLGVMGDLFILAGVLGLW